MEAALELVVDLLTVLAPEDLWAAEEGFLVSRATELFPVLFGVLFLETLSLVCTLLLVNVVLRSWIWPLEVPTSLLGLSKVLLVFRTSKVD